MEYLNKQRLNGRYRAENSDSIWESYSITMDVKETDKSYIFRLLDFKSRYGAAHIEELFRKSNRVVVRKNQKGCAIRHAMRIWPDNSFTLYPYQAGIPFYFTPVKEEPK